MNTMFKRALSLITSASIVITPPLSDLGVFSACADEPIYVATIGNTQCTTFDEALTYAYQENETITLLADASYEGEEVLDGCHITVDGDGNTLTLNHSVMLKDDLTFTDVNINSSADIYIGSNTFTIDEGVSGCLGNIMYDNAYSNEGGSLVVNTLLVNEAPAVSCDNLYVNSTSIVAGGGIAVNKSCGLSSLTLGNSAYLAFDTVGETDTNGSPVIYFSYTGDITFGSHSKIGLLNTTNAVVAPNGNFTATVNPASLTIELVDNNNAAIASINNAKWLMNQPVKFIVSGSDANCRPVYSKTTTDTNGTNWNYFTLTEQTLFTVMNSPNVTINTNYIDGAFSCIQEGGTLICNDDVTLDGEALPTVAFTLNGGGNTLFSESDILVNSDLTLDNFSGLNVASFKVAPEKTLTIGENITCPLCYIGKQGDDLEPGNLTIKTPVDGDGNPVAAIHSFYANLTLPAGTGLTITGNAITDHTSLNDNSVLLIDAAATSEDDGWRDVLAGEISCTALSQIRYADSEYSGNIFFAGFASGSAPVTIVVPELDKAYACGWYAWSASNINYIYNGSSVGANVSKVTDNEGNEHWEYKATIQNIRVNNGGEDIAAVSFADALSKVEENGTIYCGSDLTLSQESFPSFAFTIDGGGYALNADYNVFINNNLTLDNFSGFNAESLRIGEGYTLTLGSGITGELCYIGTQWDEQGNDIAMGNLKINVPLNTAGLPTLKTASSVRANLTLSDNTGIELTNNCVSDTTTFGINSVIYMNASATVEGDDWRDALLGEIICTEDAQIKFSSSAYNGKAYVGWFNYQNAAPLTVYANELDKAYLCSWSYLATNGFRYAYDGSIVNTNVSFANNATETHWEYTAVSAEPAKLYTVNNGGTITKALTIEEALNSVDDNGVITLGNDAVFTGWDLPEKNFSIDGGNYCLSFMRDDVAVKSEISIDNCSLIINSAVIYPQGAITIGENVAGYIGWISNAENADNGTVTVKSGLNSSGTPALVSGGMIANLIMDNNSALELNSCLISHYTYLFDGSLLYINVDEANKDNWSQIHVGRVYSDDGARIRFSSSEYNQHIYIAEFAYGSKPLTIVANELGAEYVRTWGTVATDKVFCTGLIRYIYNDEFVVTQPTTTAVEADAASGMVFRYYAVAGDRYEVDNGGTVTGYASFDDALANVAENGIIKLNVDAISYTEEWPTVNFTIDGGTDENRLYTDYDININSNVTFENMRDMLVNRITIAEGAVLTIGENVKGEVYNIEAKLDDEGNALPVGKIQVNSTQILDGVPQFVVEYINASGFTIGDNAGITLERGFSSNTTEFGENSLMYLNAIAPLEEGDNWRDILLMTFTAKMGSKVVYSTSEYNGRIYVGCFTDSSEPLNVVANELGKDYVRGWSYLPSDMTVYTYNGSIVNTAKAEKKNEWNDDTHWEYSAAEGSRYVVENDNVKTGVNTFAEALPLVQRNGSITCNVDVTYRGEVMPSVPFALNGGVIVLKSEMQLNESLLILNSVLSGGSIATGVHTLTLGTNVQTDGNVTICSNSDYSLEPIGRLCIKTLLDSNGAPVLTLCGVNIENVVIDSGAGVAFSNYFNVHNTAELGNGSVILSAPQLEDGQTVPTGGNIYLENTAVDTTATVNFSYGENQLQTNRISGGILNLNICAVDTVFMTSYLNEDLSSLINVSCDGNTKQTVVKRAAAVDDNGSDYWEYVLSTDIVVPAPKVTATAGDKCVILNWEAVTGATLYKVYQKVGSSWTILKDITATTYTVTGLTNGTEYTFAVRVYSGKWSVFNAETDSVSATPKDLKPIVTAAAGDSRVILSWDAVPGASLYKVYQKTSAGWKILKDITATTYTVTGLTNGTEYTFAVRSYNGSSWSAFNSATDSVSATPAALKPIVTATAGDGKVTLTWDAVTGASLYKIYQKTTSGWKILKDITATTYTVTGLTNGTEYTFAVRSYNGSSWSTFNSATDSVSATPVALKPIVIATAGDGKVTLAWNAVTGATLYKVYQKSGSGWKILKDITATTYTVTGLTNGTEYTFAVRSYNGAWSAFSAATDSVSATPVALKPIVTATAGDGKVTLAWNAVTGATLYKVYQKSGSGWKILKDITATTYTVTGLTNGTEYTFAVRSYNGAWSAFSAATDSVSATPVATKPTVTAIARDSKVTLTWNAVSGATLYKVYQKTASGWKILKDVTTTAYTITGLTNGTEYTFAVRSYNGAWSAFNAATDSVKATPSAAAKPVVIATVGDGSVTLSWDAVSGATLYKVYQKVGSGWKILKDITASSYTISGLSNGTEYTFAVRSYKNGAWSTFVAGTDAVTATPKA